MEHNKRNLFHGEQNPLTRLAAMQLKNLQPTKTKDGVD